MFFAKKTLEMQFKKVKKKNRFLSYKKVGPNQSSAPSGMLLLFCYTTDV